MRRCLHGISKLALASPEAENMGRGTLANVLVVARSKNRVCRCFSKAHCGCAYFDSNTYNSTEHLTMDAEISSELDSLQRNQNVRKPNHHQLAPRYKLHTRSIHRIQRLTLQINEIEQRRQL